MLTRGWAWSCFEDKIPLVDFSCSRSMPRTSLQGRFSPCQGQGPFLGQGGSWLSQFSHLRAFLSPCPLPAAFLSQDRLYLTGELPGTQQGLGEAEGKIVQGTSGIASMPCHAKSSQGWSVPGNNIHPKKKINKNWASQRRSDPPIPGQQVWLKIFAPVLTEVVSGNKILAIKIIYKFHFNAECKMLAPQKEAELGLLHS